MLVVYAAASGCGRVGFDALPGGAADAWWDAGWPYREQLTIDHAQVAGDVVDFPVLVPLGDPELVARAAPDFSDVVFVDEQGNLPPFELDAGHAWVRLALSASTDTHLFVYFGNLQPPAPPAAAGVWSSNYVDVVHFGTGATLEVVDSTGKNTGTNTSGATSTPNGQIGGAGHLDGVLDTGIPLTTNGVDQSAGATNTVTFWMHYTGPDGHGPFAFETGGPVYDTWYQRTGCYGFNTQQSEALGTTRTDLKGRWVYVAAVFYNGVPSPATNAIYIDGAAQTLTQCYSGGTAVSRTVQLGAKLGGNSTYEMTGDIDEVHIATGTRSPAWIATEFANQSAPAAFVTFGSLEQK